MGRDMGKTGRLMIQRNCKNICTRPCFSSFVIDCNACLTAAVEDVVPGTRLQTLLLLKGVDSPLHVGHQMTLDILVSRGKRGSMALFV